MSACLLSVSRSLAEHNLEQIRIENSSLSVFDHREKIREVSDSKEGKKPESGVRSGVHVSNSTLL